jgi:hypothetical protein
VEIQFGFPPRFNFATGWTAGWKVSPVFHPAGSPLQMTSYRVQPLFGLFNALYASAVAWTFR